MTKPHLVLIRGIPGSGKSTLAREKYVPLGYIHYETDAYFYQNGEYKFDPLLLHRNHNWCRSDTESALRHHKNVVVSNTFVKLSELVPYVKLTLDLNVVCHIIVCDGEYGSVHNVPRETIDRMKTNFWRGDFIDVVNHIRKNCNVNS